MELKNGTPIRLKVHTEIHQNDEWKDFLFEVDGQLVKMGAALYLRYQEPSEPGTQTDGNAAEMDTAMVTLKIEADGHIQIVRSGINRMRLLFGYQEYNEMHYKTPYGNLPITTYTSNLRVSLKDQPFAGDILIDYELLSGNEKLGMYHLRVEFTT